MLKKGNRVIGFITGNRFKFLEAEIVAKEYGFTLTLLSYPKLEIQATDLRKIVLFSLAELIGRLDNRPIVVEDSGLFIEALKGFPGPYSSYVYKSIGCKGILKLLKDVPPPRRATFRSCVAYHDGSGNILITEGICEGFISTDERGKGGFGFDPIFMPKGSGGRTFAEMSPNEKNRYSHRAKAFRELFSRLM